MGLQDLCGAELAVVRHQRVHAVASPVVGDGLLVGAPLHVEASLGDLAVGRVGARAATAGLLEDVLFANDAANLEVATHMVPVHDELDLQVDLGGAAQPGLGGGQALAQPLELFDGSGDVA